MMPNQTKSSHSFWRSPAKLNLFLHINGQRPNGMHELQTYFQLLDYGDDMHFEANDSGVITLETNWPELNNDQNLIIQAANRLRDCLFNKRQPLNKQQSLNRRQVTQAPFGVHIRVLKRIPMGGGLGGGSSNAATTLLALNQLWHLGLSTDELADIGQKLGADVPIFVQGQSAWAEGTGELITPLSAKPRSQWYLVLCPDCRVSTKKIFNNKGLTRNRPKCRIGLAFAADSGQLDFSQPFTNDCEAITKALYPEVEQSCDLLANEQEAEFTRMSGTGACVFGAFLTEDSANSALKRLPSNVNAFVAEGIGCRSGS